MRLFVCVTSVKVCSFFFLRRNDAFHSSYNLAILTQRRPGGSRARPPRGSGSGSAPTHGGSSAMTGRDVGLSGGGGGGEDGSGNGSGNGSGSGKMGRKLKGGGGAGDANVKPAPAKRKKGGGGWRGELELLGLSCYCESGRVEGRCRGACRSEESEARTSRCQMTKPILASLVFFRV